MVMRHNLLSKFLPAPYQPSHEPSVFLLQKATDSGPGSPSTTPILWKALAIGSTRHSLKALLAHQRQSRNWLTNQKLLSEKGDDVRQKILPALHLRDAHPHQQ